MKKLMNLSTNLFIMFGLVFTLSMVFNTQFAGADAKSEIQGGVSQASGGTTPADPAKPLNDTITTIINLLSTVTGIIAVIMIIVGGFRYVTSGGASDKVGSAKNTIVYALIGLIIIALAQVIVRFVLNRATSTGP
jgi:hypothetical protein